MRVLDFDACKKTGDWFFSMETEGVRRLSFLCPCGCGSLAGVRVRSDGQLANGAWAYNQNDDAPTCTPSINIDNGHWHGYLTDGIFKSC